MRPELTREADVDRVNSLVAQLSRIKVDTVLSDGCSRPRIRPASAAGSDIADAEQAGIEVLGRHAPARALLGNRLVVAVRSAGVKLEADRLSEAPGIACSFWSGG